MNLSLMPWPDLLDHYKYHIVICLFIRKMIASMVFTFFSPTTLFVDVSFSFHN